MSPSTAAILILTVVVLLLAAAGAGMLRRIRELELAVYRGVGIRFASSPGRAPAPAITTPGRVSVLAKLTGRCPVCADVLRGLGDSAAASDGTIDLIAVSDDADLPGKAPAGVTAIADPAVWRSVEVPYVPALLIVDEHGVVVENIPAGSGDVVADVVARAKALSKVEAS
jgi:hypothetical protein